MGHLLTMEEIIMGKIVIDPVTRVSGLLGIEVVIENNKIVDAKVSGNQFRGFEKMFIGRDPFDMVWLTARVCGICSTHHSYASASALESLMKMQPDGNGAIIRDIANGFELIQNYLRHLYLFVFPDYVDIMKVNPLFKSDHSYKWDYRLSKGDTDRINNHYEEAIKYSRDAHRALAILAGKVPHPHGIWIGGTTVNLDIPQFNGIEFTITELEKFIVDKLIPDVKFISQNYPEYFHMGKGPENFMSYGLFDKYEGENKYCKPGVIIKGVSENLDLDNIKENSNYSWLEETGEPNGYKESGYSWVEAPRYKGEPMEVGALARMKVSGFYKGGTSVMDRILAKALEAKKVCEIMKNLIAIVQIGDSKQQPWQLPQVGQGIGIVEAERGALGHWISVDNYKVSNYTLIPPSAWNLSPMDNRGVKGTVESALIGTEIKDPTSPVEIGRIVRSFDPCLNCAAHITTNKVDKFTINIIT